MLHELYLNLLRQVYDELVNFCNCLVRAQFIEADDGEVAVEFMAQAMNGADCSFDFVLMDNIMVRTDTLLLYNTLQCLNNLLLYTTTTKLLI